MLAKSVMNTTPELKRLARAADATKAALVRACNRSALRTTWRMEDAIERGEKLPEHVNAAFNAHHSAVVAYWRARGVL